ncbi:MAG: coenzyme F420-0:L-glutamate ligase [Dehalococcoidia bacterium]|jgi:coenzyme F420-0:L-glutamate ligase/coenzyme F420-1:gamma-L-glutamate ligase|nr:coenzyme F420-0:L-glutamate ligase [Dehalococcoidia bacterium]
MTAIPQLSIIGVTGIPEVNKGDDLAPLLFEAAQAQGTPLEADDIVVVTQKIVSKAEGAVVDLRDVKPSSLAEEFARQYEKDPRLVEVVLRETRRIVRMDRGVLIVETKHGFICANAGVDASNVPGEEMVSLLPEDPDGSARCIRDGLMARTGFSVAVIISDTFGRPWRMGSTDVALGVAGMNPLMDYRGQTDPYGYSLRVSVAAIADQIASAAELAAGKVSLVPVVIARGCNYSRDDEAHAKSLLREASMDLFR